MSQSFREFLHAAAPKYILPDEKTLKQRVVEKYETLKPKVEKLVTESDYLKCWTSDGWSSNVLEPYLQLTTHFIDKNFKYYELNFDFTLFPHPHDQFSSSEILSEVNSFFFIYKKTSLIEPRTDRTFFFLCVTSGILCVTVYFFQLFRLHFHTT
jgi:hypothetical protein